MDWRTVAKRSELAEGRGIVVSVEGGPTLAIFLKDGEVHALNNTCPHRGGDLGAGDLSGGLTYCPLHAWPFDLRSGCSPTHPGAAVRVYACRIEADDVQVKL